MKKETNITIANWAGVNTGDDAIFSALLNLIQTKVSRKAKIFVLADNDKLIKTKYDVIDAVRIFEYYKPKKLLKVIRFLHESDLVIYGGGDIVSGNIQSITFIGLAKLLGLPVMYCGVGAVPIKSRFVRFLFKIVSNHVDLVTVRDEKSKHILNDLGINKPPIYVTGDLALALQPADSNRISQILKNEGIDRNVKIGVNIRPYDSMYSFYTSKGLDLNKIAEVCDNIIIKYNAQIIFFPMVTKERTKNYHDNIESDDEISTKIVGAMENSGDTIILNSEYKPEEISGLLGQMDLVIAMRLHTLLLALIRGIPIIAINYAPKIENFLNSLNQLEYCIHADTLQKDEMMSLVDKQLTINNSDKVNFDLQVLKQNSDKNGVFLAQMLQQKKKNYFKFYILVIPSMILVLVINYIFIIANKFIKISRVVIQ